MGFSTSGSFLLVVTGFFIAFGTLYTATANTTLKTFQSSSNDSE